MGNCHFKTEFETENVTGKSNPVDIPHPTRSFQLPLHPYNIAY